MIIQKYKYKTFFHISLSKSSNSRSFRKRTNIVRFNEEASSNKIVRLFRNETSRDLDQNKRHFI